MSYINQALKKAQKEKDAGRIGYIRSIGGGGASSERVSGRQYLYIAAAVIILVTGGILYIIKANSKNGHEPAVIPAAIEHATDIKGQNRDIAVQKMVTPDEENVTWPDNNRKVMTDLVEGLYKKAALHMKEKRTKEALAIYKEILDKDPGHVASLNDTGALCLLEGRYFDAITYLEKAVRLKPGFVTPCYNLACAYALNNEPEKGMIYLEKAVSIDKEVKAWAKNDPDLKNLRSQSGFDALIE